MPYRLILAFTAFATVSTTTLAAGELLGPEGVPWWKSMAACAGATLGIRDAAVAASKPGAEIATLTNEMTAYNAAAVTRLRSDLGIEESSAKKSVYRWAGKTWQEYLDAKTPLADLQSRAAICKELLAKLPKAD